MKMGLTTDSYICYDPKQALEQIKEGMKELALRINNLEKVLKLYDLIE